MTASDVLRSLIAEAVAQGQPNAITARLRDALAVIPTIEQARERRKA